MSGHETIAELRAEIRRVLSEGHESRVDLVSRLSHLNGIITNIEVRMEKIDKIEERVLSSATDLAVLKEKVERLEKITYTLAGVVAVSVVGALLRLVLK